MINRYVYKSSLQHFITSSENVDFQCVYKKIRITLLILFLLTTLATNNIYAQTTIIVSGEYRCKSVDKNITAKLYSVEIYDDCTKVTIALEPSKNIKWLYFYSSRNTHIYIDDENIIPIKGFEVNGEFTTEPFDGNAHWDKAKADTDYFYTMVFESAIPRGVTSISIIDDGNRHIGRGASFVNCKINNPAPNHTEWDEFSIRKFVDENDDEICGIYDEVGNDKLRLGCVKENGEYKLIYLGEKKKTSWWNEGDLKAELFKTATAGFFKANFFMKDTKINSDYYVSFDGKVMKINAERLFIKMYPIYDSDIKSSAWSGTGFALNEKYIVTNHHVAGDAKTINIFGVNGNFQKSYTAKVVATDKTNDIAILKLDSCNLGIVPYNVKTSISDVGENIFVLGYPETTRLGDELKLTTGVISAKTGYQGDLSSYQITAPTYHGNSGSPLFDENGNIIGIMTSMYGTSANVNYAVKTLYLKNLLASFGIDISLPSSNDISDLSLPEKVKRIRNFVYLLKCSSNGNSQSENQIPFTVNNPVVTTPYAEHAKIQSVTFEKDYTSVTLAVKNSGSYYSWCNLYPDVYIVVNGERYTMTRAEGIKIAPEKTHFQNITEPITFTIYFPTVTTIPATMDFVEPGESDWKFFGIKISNE